MTGQSGQGNEGLNCAPIPLTLIALSQSLYALRTGNQTHCDARHDQKSPQNLNRSSRTMELSEVTVSAAPTAQ